MTTSPELLAAYGPREVVGYDVVIVGGGPAGLATSIRLKQLAAERGVQISVCVLEKGDEPGAHVMSGAILDPRSLNELIPDWRERGAPVQLAVTQDQFLFMSSRRTWMTPDVLLPDCFRNKGNYIVSLGALTRWMARQAEALGVEIFSGFAADDVLYGDIGEVIGVTTIDSGLDRTGVPMPDFQLGLAVHARYTVLAEGARGHLGKKIIERYSLDDGRDPPSFAIGIKEVWQASPSAHQPGLAIHTAGWPLDASTYGGSFLYHADEGRIAIGFIVGLDYRNPWLSPFEEFQRFKTHPDVRRHLEGGSRLAYGARAINAGGLNSLPRLVFPGGLLVGCEAGFLNASRIKGSHAALKSGMLAAEGIFIALAEGRSHDEVVAYPESFERSWLAKELLRSKNFKQWFKHGLALGTLMTGIEQWLLPKLGFKSPPWNLRNSRSDREYLEPATSHPRIDYLKPDGIVSFDRLSSVFLSGVSHPENQPSHLLIKDPNIPVHLNLPAYAGPEARYCPAGVYEFLEDDSGTRLQVNASNCIHCKTCDIKDPTGNITWVAPRGGPNYSNL